MKNNSTQNTAPTSEQVSSPILNSSQKEYLSSKQLLIVNQLMVFVSLQIVQLLCHLEHFRRSCRHGNGTGTGLYVQDAMQRALQQAFSNSSDSTKVHFSLHQWRKQQSTKIAFLFLLEFRRNNTRICLH